MVKNEKNSMSNLKGSKINVTNKMVPNGYDEWGPVFPNGPE